MCGWCAVGFAFCIGGGGGDAIFQLSSSKSREMGATNFKGNAKILFCRHFWPLLQQRSYGVGLCS